MKGLIITSEFDDKILDGGEFINKRNYEILYKCCDRLDIIKTSVKSNNSLRRKINTFFDIFIYGSFYGISFYRRSKIVDLLKTGQYDFCFISQSLGGNLAYLIKQKIKNIRVIVFFHNVEYDFYKQLAKTSSKYKYLLAWNAKKNEEYAVKYADDIIALNDRDALKIEKIYGRRADLIFPTTFNDLCKEIKLKKNTCCQNIKIKKLLFVGSNFFANLAGIQWFIENVLIDLTNVVLIIVGKGTETWRKEFININNVKIMGSVDSLSSYYEMADAVVLPIFLGSGMKTKTAEALMYGKYIFGTTEAFEGYDLDYDKVGAKCDTKEEFIIALNKKLFVINDKYNEYARKIFLEKYSNDVWVSKIKRFLYNK